MRIRSTAERTSSNDFWVSDPISNSTTVDDSPSVTVEVTCLTPATLATAASTGRVTWVSTSLAAAPDSTTLTATTGNDTSGYSLIGSAR